MKGRKVAQGFLAGKFVVMNSPGKSKWGHEPGTWALDHGQCCIMTRPVL